MSKVLFWRVQRRNRSRSLLNRTRNLLLLLHNSSCCLHMQPLTAHYSHASLFTVHSDRIHTSNTMMLWKSETVNLIPSLSSKPIKGEVPQSRWSVSSKRRFSLCQNANQTTKLRTSTWTGMAFTANVDLNLPTNSPAKAQTKLSSWNPSLPCSLPHSPRIAS